MDKDKLVELNRYETRAKLQLTQPVSISGEVFGSSSLPIYLRAPYLLYEQKIYDFVKAHHRVLELGVGTGNFTLALARKGAGVIAVDISPNMLKLLVKRIKQAGGVVNTMVADMEVLPFEDDTFDIVASAGSLSYGDNECVLAEIWRCLKPGGKFICVDSLNENPIYRLNRWVHYLRGNRTKNTLRRMPSLKLLARYRHRFVSVDIQYFGAISFLAPFMIHLLGDKRTAAISNSVDRLLEVKCAAFKFVMVATKET